MTVGTINHSATYTPASLQATAQPQPSVVAEEQATATITRQPSDTPVAETKVSISDEARKLQADDRAAQNGKLPEAKPQEAKTQEAEKDLGDKAEAFAYGALGMDHPEEVKASSDGYYNAGQWLAAAGTVATVLLAVA